MKQVSCKRLPGTACYRDTLVHLAARETACHSQWADPAALAAELL